MFRPANAHLFHSVNRQSRPHLAPTPYNSETNTCHLHVDIEIASEKVGDVCSTCECRDGGRPECNMGDKLLSETSVYAWEKCCLCQSTSIPLSAKPNNYMQAHLVGRNNSRGVPPPFPSVLHTFYLQGNYTKGGTRSLTNKTCRERALAKSVT